jgi:glutamyl-tRNA reductase
MIKELKLINLPPHSIINKKSTGEVFTMQTCQRTLVLGFNFVPHYIVGNNIDEAEILIGEEAYHYLLETICGLKSKMLAENEVVGQFKTAYSNYVKEENKNTHIMSILEKLFKDAKEIRTKFLLDLGQHSYAGVARKILKNKSLKGEVLILGAGQLAQDTANLLKRKYKISLSARNSSKSKEFIKVNSDANINEVSWNDYHSYKDFKFIINTIGANVTLFTNDFFETWKSNQGELFIDLGSPSILETDFGINDGIYRLDDIFTHGDDLSREKENKVSLAKLAILKIVEKRKTSFSVHLPFGWEELEFA